MNHKRCQNYKYIWVRYNWTTINDALSKLTMGKKLRVLPSADQYATNIWIFPQPRVLQSVGETTFTRLVLDEVAQRYTQRFAFFRI